MDNGNRQKLKNIIKNTIDTAGVSDYYFATGMPPALRESEAISLVTGTGSSGDSGNLTQEDIIGFLDEYSPKYEADKIPYDFGVTFDGRRLRCNLDQTWQGLDLTIRLLPRRIKTLKELGLPESLYGLTDTRQGFILICGPTGSGKSTTLASLINNVNEKQVNKIVMLEDPIEYIIPRKNSLIHQREITAGSSFLPHLRSAVRQHPDIIVIGEIRDRDTAVMAVQAAETGHLVLATMHTISAQQTLIRIADMLPEDAKNNILSILSNTLKAIIVQRLIRDDRGNVRVAYEVCLVDNLTGQLIRTAKYHQIPNRMMLTQGCVTMNDSLVFLIRKGYLTFEEAQKFSYDPDNLQTS
jgi:twitching motility protein PilT